VIALGTGGVLESVRDGETGVYYRSAEPDVLADAVSAFDPLSIDPKACVAAARRFDAADFQRRLRSLVADAVSAERSPKSREMRRIRAGILRAA